MITIKFFASLRERLGVDSIQLELTSSITVSQLQQHLIAQHEDWSDLQQGKVLCAVNHTLCDANTTIHDGDEVAFFPPVTGG
ncbi:molybdopterin converting factor subunit 1 [Aestuariibacter salexigens]|uniref:molybdopterin converting factor subunit 1 n=1 Tax=Aestuariibacter salexigens TaxID=226010 RepID=UPI0003FEBDF3|nr:molybdopterin converting factor subunit 1 [Aestuariibacter salexigens]